MRIHPVIAQLEKGIAAALLAAIISCSRDPVQWSDVKYSLAGIAGSPVGEVVDSSAVQDSGDAAIPIPDSARCRLSVRIARAGKSFFAAWWSVRKDSSSNLLTSRSDDGGPWTSPVAADTTDASSRGCARPAPSIATDVVSGYVHLAYYVEAPSGAGVFSVHTMDRGASFHAPVPMVFGARPGNTSVTAEGDKVAVAYEDPNSGTRSQIFVALSRTMGHLFGLKLPVSEESGSAIDPVARLRGTKLEVSWTEINPSDSTRRRQASRTGIWK